MNTCYQRIMIFGRPGSGKSTFASSLARKCDLPLYHLDKYFYEDHWVERHYPDFLALQQELVSKDRWVIDGNATRSLEMRWQRADCVLYFRLPLPICYYRVWKRYLCNQKNFDDRAPNCPEQISWSLLKYMWGFEQRVSVVLTSLQRKYPAVLFFDIRSDRDKMQAFEYITQGKLC